MVTMRRFKIRHWEVWFLLSILITDLGLASAKKCGYVPSQVTLKRGERQKLVFWTDQNYDNPPPEELVVAEPDAGDQNGQETIEADEFLAAVNGMMKPSAAEDSTSSDEQPSPTYQPETVDAAGQEEVDSNNEDLEDQPEVEEETTTTEAISEALENSEEELNEDVGSDNVQQNDAEVEEADEPEVTTVAPVNEAEGEDGNDVEPISEEDDLQDENNAAAQETPSEAVTQDASLTDNAGQTVDLEQDSIDNEILEDDAEGVDSEINDEDETPMTTEAAPESDGTEDEDGGQVVQEAVVTEQPMEEEEVQTETDPSIIKSAESNESEEVEETTPTEAPVTEAVSNVIDNEILDDDDDEDFNNDGEIVDPMWFSEETPATTMAPEKELIEKDVPVDEVVTEAAETELDIMTTTPEPEVETIEKVAAESVNKPEVQEEEEPQETTQPPTLSEFSEFTFETEEAPNESSEFGSEFSGEFTEFGNAGDDLGESTEAVPLEEGTPWNDIASGQDGDEIIDEVIGQVELIEVATHLQSWGSEPITVGPRDQDEDAEQTTTLMPETDNVQEPADQLLINDGTLYVPIQDPVVIDKNINPETDLPPEMIHSENSNNNKPSPIASPIIVAEPEVLPPEMIHQSEVKPEEPVLSAVVQEIEDEILIKPSDQQLAQAGGLVDMSHGDGEGVTDAPTDPWPEVGGSLPVVQAVEAEVESATDDDGNLIETTTGDPLLLRNKVAQVAEKLEKVKATASESQVVAIKQTTKVNGKLSLDNVQYYDDTDDSEYEYVEEGGNGVDPDRDLEKLPRREDDDVAAGSDLLSIQVLTVDENETTTESAPIGNITDPSDKPGSILTTLIDGFLLPKQPKPADFLEEKDKSAAIDEESANKPGFIVKDILTGVYSFVSSYIKDEQPENVEPVTAIPKEALNVHNMPRDQLLVQAAEVVVEDPTMADPLPLDAPMEDVRQLHEVPQGFAQDVRPGGAPPLPLLPGEFPRGSMNKPTAASSATASSKAAKPVLILSRDPVSIPLMPDLIGQGNVEDNFSSNDNDEENKIRSLPFDPVESLRNGDKNVHRFINAQPLPIREHFLGQRRKRQAEESDEEEADATTIAPEVERDQDPDDVNCNWNIKTEPGLYLLVTFHNLSAPFTLDCEGAFIEVERENNGFDARWCGNRVTQGGSRPHVIFAKNEVRVTVFDDGNQDKDLPTGFSADVEVIDLFDGQKFSEDLRKTNSYSNIRLAG